MIDIPRDLPPLGHVGYIVEDIDAGVDGRVGIELIQPGEGATPQASFLQEKGPGLHHVAFYSERYEEWLDRFRRLGAEISFEAEAEDEINGYRRSFYAEVAGMPGIVEISEIARDRGGERT
ncbi:MAG: hypothetical protein A2177_15965 [Spirochaetes bacterium RBG_13_68_11]|nr:MAG: hypothetical protein A2177_15965 [Spirochaetes bacterium RBG_13_68_11]